MVILVQNLKFRRQSNLSKNYAKMTTPPRLILASSSPRRCQLLTEAGYTFEVVEPHDDAESGVPESVGPVKYVAELALRKGADVVQQLIRLGEKEPQSPHIVLAADTVAECEGRILGKPTDAQDARNMLQFLSNREHRVLTGVSLALLGQGGAVSNEQTEVVETVLQMSPLPKAWLDEFIASEKWRGKAGGFGFQDALGVIAIVEGSGSNVVGLPMERVSELLSGYGCMV